MEECYNSFRVINTYTFESRLCNFFREKLNNIEIVLKLGQKIQLTDNLFLSLSSHFRTIVIKFFTRYKFRVANEVCYNFEVRHRQFELILEYRMEIVS